MMLKVERHSIILDELRIHKRIKSTQLCGMLNVSEDTIRRDLNELESNGQLKKVHGGAITLSFIPSFKKREVQEIQTKHDIARKALELIKDDDVIIIDGGTSNLQLINMLPEDMKLTIFTNSIPVASKLCEYPNVDGVLLGGNILRKGHSIIGYQALESLKEVHADKCFLGITSVDSQAGLSEANRKETTIKRAMINASNKVITMVTSGKLNTRQPFKVCELSCLDVMVTELNKNDDLLKPYKDKGIKIY